MNKAPKTTKLPSFDTVEQLMADEYLIGRVQSIIDDMSAARDRVSEGGKIKLRPSPVEFMVQMNKFNADFITTEYIEIYNKRSKLNYSFREFITYLINEAVGETFKHYETLFQKQNKKTSKSTKNGKNEH